VFETATVSNRLSRTRIKNTRAIARNKFLLIKVFQWIFKNPEDNDGAGNRPDVFVIVK